MRRRVVQHIERAEAPRVRILQLGQLILQQDVFLADVAKDKRDLGLVVGVVEDGPAELVHGRDARAAGDQRNMLVLVGLPRVLGDGTLYVQPLAGHHVVQVGRHRPVGVLLDQQIDVSLLSLVADGSVRPDNGLVGPNGVIFRQDGRRDVQTRDHVVLGQAQPQTLGVVVDELNVLQLEGQPALLAAGEGLLGLGRSSRGSGLLEGFFSLLRRALDGRGGAAAAQEVVACAGEDCGAGSVEKGVAAGLFGFSGLGGVAADEALLKEEGES